ncbi:molybdate ABC transporter substrate-binding protein [Arthrobacter pityocampae]|uniref:Molybdate ABC transporter substrate-binding protein n=1 Tax=Arthrobacter pityocampae TaxID=547334 RepID=A0A2S5J1E3_9MICC|nr:molybdate ABC transporter substrate-binding protein [Arthrobacter pityocampae]PPB50560.1 molybdate ABC transporter substrate-binding protein [Arthrobacter pityocampae]
MSGARLTSGRGIAAAASGAAVLLALTGCGATSPDAAAGSEGNAIDGSITVFAAASLTAAFTDLAGQFEEAHPGAEVTLNFAGSSDLATQIGEGAPADVLASADTDTMGRVTDLLAADPVAVATNTLQLAVPADNPAGITSLADAARPGVRTVVCARQVPCGAAAAAVGESAGVDLTPVSEESSVTDVLGKVTSGEADAGLVYVTDVRSAGDAVRGIDVPEAARAPTTYPIAALAGSGDPATAQEFVDFAAGPSGQSVLRSAGFGAP